MQFSRILNRKAMEAATTDIRQDLTRSVFMPFMLMSIICVVFIYQTYRLLSLSTKVEHTNQSIALIHAIQNNVITLKSAKHAASEQTQPSVPNQLAALERLVQSENELRHERTLNVERSVRSTVIITIIIALTWGTILVTDTRRQIFRISDSYKKIVEDLAITQAELKLSHSELEFRVQERTEALTASNAELESFCYSVSHDLRAPLRGIDGFSQALLEDYNTVLDTTGKNYLMYVREGVQKMGRLIDDLLDLSRVTRAEMQTQSVDLNAIADSIIVQLKRQEPDRRVTFENIAQNQGIVQGDSGLLTSLLQNLLLNAWKFTSKKHEALIEFGIDPSFDKKTFYIKDNGAGFDMAYKNKLFGAFQRLHSSSEFKGTGVGLATVRRITHRHGGEVWAESKIGVGASFYFTLN